VFIIYFLNFQPFETRVFINFVLKCVLFSPITIYFYQKDIITNYYYYIIFYNVTIISYCFMEWFMLSLSY